MASADHDRHLEEIFASYVERLNNGEEIDPEKILAENPVLGGDIVEYLEEYVGFTASLRDPNQPLGTLGDYTLRRQIGRGGMGVVYEAWENSMDRAVALKVLPAGIAADEKAVARFVREAQLAGRLNHPNVVSVHGMGIKEQTPYYAMEYVEGETLAQILAKVKEVQSEAVTPFGHKDGAGYFEQIARAFADVADGLQHAHSKGVIHRDIKPSNLILDGGGRLRILDFGLARLEGQESLTGSGDVVGTPLYMSPEQARRKKIPLDHRTDIYSLGATMYEAICGRPPFRGKDHADTLSQIIERDPVDPRKLSARIPRDLETIVLKCLRKDAGDRYGTAEALGQDLRRFVRGDPVEARPVTQGERLLRQLLRQRVRIASVALVTILLVAVGWLLLEQRETLIKKRTRDYETRVLEAARRVDLAIAVKGYQPSVGGQSSVERFDWLDEVIYELAGTEKLAPSEPDAPYHRARALRAQGRHDEALAVLEVLPDFVPAALLEARIHRSRREKELEDAARARAEALAGEETTVARLWLDARDASWENRHAEAVALYDRILALPLSERNLYLGFSRGVRTNRARARLEIDEHLAALGDLIIVDYESPSALEARVLQGKALLLLGYEREAHDLFESLHDETEFKDEVALAIGGALASLGRKKEQLDWIGRVVDDALRERRLLAVLWDMHEYHQAVEAGWRAVKLDPTHGSLYERFGRLLLDLGKDGEAARLLREGLRHVERPAPLYAQLAVVNYENGYLGEAARLARKVTKLDPYISQGWGYLGYALCAEGLVDEAVKVFDQGADYSPRFLPWFEGNGLYVVGRYEDALKAFNRDVHYNPKSGWSRGYRGITLRALGRRDEALEELRFATTLFPRRAKVFQDYAFELVDAGDLDSAVDTFEELFRMKSGSVGGLQRLRRALRADTPEFSSEQTRRLAAALEGAIQKEPRSTALVEALFALYLHGVERRTEEARRVLDEADARFDEPRGELLALRAELLGLEGEHEAAIVALEAAQRTAQAPGDDSLERHRVECLPDLPTVESVDAALERARIEVLVPEGATWRLLRGSTPPPDGWTAPEFDDSAWEAGRSGFGYGDGGVATELDDMLYNYTSLSIRTKFQFDPERHKRLELALRVDDGAIAWLNGHEITCLRASADPASEIAVAQRPRGPLLTERAAIPPEALRPGENVLAVRGFNIHSRSRGFTLIPVVEAHLAEPSEPLGSILERYAPIAKSLDARGRLRYLEGRLAQLEGDPERAERDFANAAALLPGSTQVTFRLAETQRAVGKPEEALATLEAALAQDRNASGEYYELWATIVHVDLNLLPAAALERLPESESPHAKDLRWALARLADGEALRIDCGAEKGRETAGRSWSRDRFAVGGAVDPRHPYFGRGSRVYHGEVHGAGDAEIFRSQRYFSPHCSYRVPLPPGTYRVTLWFAETVTAVAGRRRLDVHVEGETRLQDFEPLEAGYATASSKQFEVDVRDGWLDLDFASSAKAAVAAIEIEALPRAGP